jgi:hypothetical protein
MICLLALVVDTLYSAVTCSRSSCFAAFTGVRRMIDLAMCQKKRGAECCNLPENWRVSPGQTSVQYDRPLSASAPHVSNPFPRAAPYCKLLMGKIVGQAPVVICGSEQIESHEH